MIKKYKRNEKGFALPIALLVLVVMSIMAATLVTITSKDHAANNRKDSSQQAFYAAESGIAVAKKWMVDNPDFTKSSQKNLDRDLKFCKANLFPNLKNSYGYTLGRKSLNEVISASGDEGTRLSKYSFEYFFSYSPDKNGNNSSPKKKPGTNNIYYTIFSCGCNATKTKCNSQGNIIVSLEAVVTLVK